MDGCGVDKKKERKNDSQFGDVWFIHQLVMNIVGY